MRRFIPAEELKQSYDVFGHFYSVEIASGEIVECRSVLEIADKARTPNDSVELSKRKPDAVFIMMNPGSSQPLVEVNNRIPAEAIHELPISLVPTKPDTTQYQVMRLMHFCEWRHVRVLNLSDLRGFKSGEFFKQFKRLEEAASFDSHSIFSGPRKNELDLKFPEHDAIPVIRAWGVSAELDPLIERCTSTLSKTKTVRGLMKEGTTNKFLHPLPSLQSQKLVWVSRMVEQCQESRSSLLLPEDLPVQEPRQARSFVCADPQRAAVFEADHDAGTPPQVPDPAAPDAHVDAPSVEQQCPIDFNAHDVVVSNSPAE